MSLNLCAYQPAVIWSSGLYIAFGVFMLVGLMFSPGNFTDHQSKLEKGLADCYRTIQLGNWQSVIFALFLPLLWLFFGPIIRPVIFLAAASGCLLIGLAMPC